MYYSLIALSKNDYDIKNNFYEYCKKYKCFIFHIFFCIKLCKK